MATCSPHQTFLRIGRIRNQLLSIFTFLVLMSAASVTSANASAHWQGEIAIPGKATGVVLDLDKNKEGAWQGSITLPGLNISAVPLADIHVAGNQVRFTIPNILDDEATGPAKISGNISNDTFSGEFSQAGHRAPFVMQRSGVASVILPPRSTPVGKALEGDWVGEFIGVGGYARHVTISLSHPTQKEAQAKFVVIGKQTVDLPVDLVMFVESQLRVTSSAYDIYFEGQYRPESGEISGAFVMGTFEFPLVLKRRPTGGKP